MSTTLCLDYREEESIEILIKNSPNLSKLNLTDKNKEELEWLLENTEVLVSYYYIPDIIAELPFSNNENTVRLDS